LDLSPELVTALSAVLVALLTGLAGWLNKRERSRAEELKHLAEEFADLRRQILLSDTWLFNMARTLTQHGIPVPSPPRGLKTNFGVGGDSVEDD